MNYSRILIFIGLFFMVTPSLHSMNGNGGRKRPAQVKIENDYMQTRAKKRQKITPRMYRASAISKKLLASINPKKNETNCLQCAARLAEFLGNQYMAPKEASVDAPTGPNFFSYETKAHMLSEYAASILQNYKTTVVKIEGEAKLVTDIETLQNMPFEHVKWNELKSHLDSKPLYRFKNTDDYFYTSMIFIQFAKKDGDYTGHFLNVYITHAAGQVRETRFICAQSGEIYTLAEFINKNEKLCTDTIYIENVTAADADDNDDDQEDQKAAHEKISMDFILGLIKYKQILPKTSLDKLVAITKDPRETENNRIKASAALAIQGIKGLTHGHGLSGQDSFNALERIKLDRSITRDDRILIECYQAILRANRLIGDEYMTKQNAIIALGVFKQQLCTSFDNSRLAEYYQALLQSEDKINQATIPALANFFIRSLN